MPPICSCPNSLTREGSLISWSGMSSANHKLHHFSGFLGLTFSKSKSKSNELIASPQVQHLESGNRSHSASDLTSIELVTRRPQLLNNPCIVADPPAASEGAEEKTGAIDAIPCTCQYFVCGEDQKQIMSLIVSPPSRPTSPSFVTMPLSSPASAVAAPAVAAPRPGDGLEGLERTLQKVKIQLVSIGM